MKPLFLFVTLTILLGSCKPSDQKTEVTEQTGPSQTPVVDSTSIPVSDAVSADTTSGQQTAIAAESDVVSSTAKTPPPVPAKTKVCDPNFTKLSTIKNHYIFYVSDFNAEEFKCWVLLEEHGVSICNGSPCVVYYVDNVSKMVVHPGLPHHMDDETLRTIGVGRFEYNGKYWEIKGASQWKRKDKGYGYYNTDNQLGG